MYLREFLLKFKIMIHAGFKNILYCNPFTLGTSLSITHKSRLKYEIEYDLYKIAQKTKNLKKLKFGLLSCSLGF